MGRPDFMVVQLMVQYDLDGNPVSVKYWDQEGCGHESRTFSVESPISLLTTYHVRHAKVSHEMVLPRKCPEVLSVKGEAGQDVNIRCSRDEHLDDGDRKHAFEW